MPESRISDEKSYWRTTTASRRSICSTAASLGVNDAALRAMRLDHQIKDRLVARQRALTNRYLAELLRADEELGAPDLGRVGKAAARYDAQLLLTMGEADERALTEVAAAIRRFDAGDYGSCIQCGHDIGPKRLAVLPEVALCFGCAARAERHRR
jgi:DnaK suppressor protein